MQLILPLLLVLGLLELLVHEELFHVVREVLLPLGLFAPQKCAGGIFWVRILVVRLQIVVLPGGEDLLLLRLALFLRLLLHSLRDSLEGILDLLHDDPFARGVDDERLSATLEDPEAVEGGQVGLLILFRDNPRLDTVEDHLVDSDSIPEVDRFLEPQDPKDL